MTELTLKERNKIKRRKKKVVKICKMYARDRHTIAECCRKFNVTFASFWKWTNEHDEFEEMYQEAKETKDALYRENIVTRCETSFEKLVSGHKFEEVKIQYQNVFDTDADGNPTKEIIQVEGKKTVTEKTVIPNVTAVIFGLKNLKPEQWNEKSHIEIGGKAGQPIPYAGFNFIIGGTPEQSPENLTDGSAKA